MRPVRALLCACFVALASAWPIAQSTLTIDTGDFFDRKLKGAAPARR